MSARPAFHRRGFRHGLGWLPAGAELLWRGRRPMLGLAALWLLVSLVAVVPVIGQGVLAVFTPLLTAGVLSAFAALAQGRSPRPGMLFAGWHDPRRRNGLLLIGVWGLVGSMLAVAVLVAWLGDQISAGELEQALADPETLAAFIGQASLGPGLFMALVVLAVVVASMYFAVPLVMFAGTPVVGALTTSLRAMLVNWLAFLGFGLAVAILILALGVVLALLMLVVSLALGTLGQLVAQVVFLLVTVAVQLIMVGAQFVAFSDLFPAPGGDEDDDGSDDDAGRMIA